MNLYIYGANNLGREVLEIVKLQPDFQTRWEQIYFIDDINPNRKVRDIYPVYTFEQVKASASRENSEFLIATGEPAHRKLFYERIKEAGFHLTTLIHPTITIPDSTTIEEGVIIGGFCLISCDITIHSNAYIQNHVSIGHDSVIGSHSVLSAFDAVSGNCLIGEETYLAMSVPVKEETTIGKQSIVGMGSVVSRNIPDGVIAMGNPARAMKNNEEHRVFR